MPVRNPSRHARRRIASAAATTTARVETLEPRKLLTTIAGNDVVEFIDAGGNTQRVRFAGNGRIELVGVAFDFQNEPIIHNIPLTVIERGGIDVEIDLYGGRAGADGVDPLDQVYFDINGVPFQIADDASITIDIPGGPTLGPGSDENQVRAIAANSRGRVWGFNVSQVPNPDPDIDEDITIGALLNFDYRGSGDGTAFADLAPLITGGTNDETNNLKDIVAADFSPNNPNKLYFVAIVTESITGDSGQKTEVDFPVLYVYNLAASDPATALTRLGRFRTTSTPTQNNIPDVADISFTDDGELVAYVTAFRGGQTVVERSGFITLGIQEPGDIAPGEPNARFSFNNVLRTRTNADNDELDDVTDIEIIPRDGGNVYVVDGTDLWHVSLVDGKAVLYGSLLDPDDEDADDQRGNEIGDLTWVPTVPNPLRLQDANPANDNQKGILIGTDTAKDEFILIEPAVRPPGSNLFNLYVTETDADSHVSIATVPDFNPDQPNLPRPMIPFDGDPGVIRVADNVFGANDTAEGHRTVSPEGGASFIGARTLDVIDNEDFEQDVPVRRLRRPNGLDLGLVPEEKFLYAGLQVTGAMGRFYFGGTITGRVYLGGNTEQFYAGCVLTGIPSGRWGATSLNGTVLVDSGEDYNQVRRNFYVNGDLRNFATFETVGGVTGDSDQNNFDYASGFDMYVKGRLGQARSRRNLVGAVKVENNRNVDIEGDAQRELEYFGGVLPANSDQTYFEGNHGQTPYSGVPTLGDLRLGDQETADDFSNDTFEVPEILSTAFAAGFDSDEVIVLDGILRGGNGAGFGAADGVDYYGVGLVAGQRITVDIDVVGTANIGVYDPDGRLIASDYTNNDFASNNNQPFAFLADRPGLYRIAVARAGDGNFNDVLDAGETITTTNDTRYRLTVTGKLADIALGGISTGTPATVGDFIGFNSSFNPIAVLNGDVGGLLAQGSIGGGVLDEAQVVTALPDAFYIERGNLRSVEARDLGFFREPGSGTTFVAGTGPDFIVPKGVIGGIRANKADSGVLAMNDDGVITDTDPAAALRYAPVDVQLIEASGQFTDFVGNIVSRRRIGVVKVREMDNVVEPRGDAGSLDPITGTRSGTRVPPPIIAANVDNRAGDGIIDLIDVVGDMGGLLTGGGPALSAGPGGNIRYVNVGGNAFRDRFFGGGAPETIVSDPDTSVDLVDDSGTAYRVSPILAQSGPPVFGQPVNNNPTVNGVVSVVALPVRNSLSGGRSGLVAISATSTTGMLIESRARGSRGSVELGAISTSATNGKPIVEAVNGTLSQPAGAGLVDVNFTMTGNVPVDVFSIAGQNFTEISNTTRGEIINVSANDIGSLIGYNLGVGKSSTGALVNPLSVNPSLGAAPISVYPFLEQTFGIAAAGSPTGGSILSIRARGAVGNVGVGGTLDSVAANVDRRNDKGVFEGIVGPIVSFRPQPAPLTTYGIRSVNIGEGILPSGTGAVSFAGLYSILRMGTIANQGLGSDVRGDIHSQTRIDGINLTDGAVINSDVLVTSSFIDSQEYPRAFSAPEVFSLVGDPFEIGGLTINGVGGVIGGYFSAADVGPININGGFGVMQTLITAVGDGIIGGIVTDGFGIRSTTIEGGSTVQNLVARGNGTRLPTTAYTGSVRQSENGNFDPFFLSAPTRLTDLHAFLGTTKKAPKRKGWSNAGVIDSVVAAASRDLEQVRAWAIQNRFNSGIGATDDAYPMRFSFGRDIVDLRVTESIDGLAVSAGNIRFFTTGGDVLKSTIAASGLIDSMTVGGNLRGSARILADGPDGQINGLNVKKALYGEVQATLRIGMLKVGTDFGSANVSSSNSIGTVTIGRNILSGSLLRARNRIDSLVVGNDIQVDAVVSAKSIGNQQIGGDVFGEIRIG